MFFGLVFDEIAEAGESGIPLFRNQVEKAVCFFQAAPLQLPDAFASLPRIAHQAGSLHHAQVFRDRLTTELGASRESLDRHGPVITQARDKAQAGLVTQGRE